MLQEKEGEEEEEEKSVHIIVHVCNGYFVRGKPLDWVIKCPFLWTLSLPFFLFVILFKFHLELKTISSWSQIFSSAISEKRSSNDADEE